MGRPAAGPGGEFDAGPATRRAPVVCYAAWDDDPPVGGQGVCTRELRRSLVDRGLTVRSVSGHGSHAITYRRVTGRAHVDMSIALNRRPSILLAGHPDLVHLSGGPGGLQLLRRLPVPVLYTANHTFRQAHGPLQALRLYGRVEAAAYRRADRVAAISPSTADAVVAMGISPERVVVISPGIETDPMLTDERRVEGRMLFFGRLEPEKNPLQAVAVMREVARLVPGAHGRVLGSGALATAVANACAASGGAVTFAGRLSDDDVVEELRAARVVVVPSDYEGLGLVALEAMARGAAVVAYDVTGLRDAVADLGVLVGHGDVAAMVEASRSLLVDEQARADIARRAFDAVRNERSWDRCAAEYHALYLDVIG